ncbi:MAG: ABC transporter substrate-binding protein [Spirochaetales bacterium]
MDTSENKNSRGPQCSHSENKGRAGKIIRVTNCLLLNLFILFFLFTLFSCQTRTTFRLGFSTSLTGRGASLGKDLYEGTLLAVEEINKNKGPYQIELLVRDDGGDKRRALANAQEFANLGIEAVTGYSTSSIAQSVLPFLEEKGIVLVGASISSPIFDKKDDALFRIVNSSLSEARAVADYIAESSRLPLFIGLYDEDNTAYAKAWLEAFNERYQRRGGKVTDPIGFRSILPPGYPSIIEQALKQFNLAEGLCVAGSSIDTASFAQAFKKQVPHGLVAVSGWANNQDLITFGGQAVEGSIIAQSHNPIDTTPAFIQFKERFQDAFGRTPHFGSVHAFEAIQYLYTALQGRKKGEPLKEAFKRVRELQGVQRMIRFDTTGDAYRPLFIITIQSGKFCLLSEREPEL